MIEDCSKELSGKNKSNLVAHVRRKHEKFYKKNFGATKFQILKVIPLPIRRLQYIQNCVEFVAVNRNAFTILNQSGMKNLMQSDYDALRIGGFGSGLGRPNYPAIKKHIKYLSGAIVNKIKSEVRGGFISVMADTATKYRRSILGLSIQYMYNGQLKIRTIGMVNMTVSQTAENLMNAIINQLKFYEIDLHQVLSITTDNANSMTAMVNLINTCESNVDHSTSGHEFENRIETDETDNDDNSDSNDDADDGDNLQDSDSEYNDNIDTADLYELPESFFDMNADDSLQLDEADNISEAESDDEERRQEVNAILDETDEFERLLKDLEKRFSVLTMNIKGIRCAVHTLQLAIRDALKECSLEKLIIECRKLCKLLKKGKVKSFLKRNNISIPTPRLDCKTRWNSTYRMVKIEFYCMIV